jgi:peptidyl-prolyl cis-trans isomerase A (cyclophilin A)
MLKETTTSSGIKVQILKEGDGEKPALGDVVSSHYIINLGEGASTSEYDYEKQEYIDSLVESTYEEKPFSGPVEFVIGKRTPIDDTYSRGDSLEGLDKAFMDMKMGEKRRLLIPSRMAYGELGASSFHTFYGYRTPPNADLDIVVEIVDIKRK